MKGRMLIVGITRDEEDEDEEVDEEDEDDDKDQKYYSAEQLATMRFVLLDDARVKQLNKYRDLVTGGQGGDDFRMFNTSTGNHHVKFG
jgi:hypothetical protein